MEDKDISRHPSDLETLAGDIDSSDREESQGQPRSWPDPQTIEEAVKQRDVAIRSGVACQAEAEELRRQLRMVLEAMRHEEGYSAAILGLLMAGTPEAVALADLLARNAAESRAKIPATSEWHGLSASWTLNQAHQRHRHASALALSSKEVAGQLVLLLSAEDESQVSGAAWSLADLIQAGEAPCQDCVDAGCIPSLLAVVRSGGGSAREAAAMALEMLSRDPDLHPALVDANCINAVTQALLAEVEAGKMALTRLLERFSRTDQYQAQIVEAGGIAAAVQLLEDGKPSEQQLAARVVGNLAEDDGIRQQLLMAPEVVTSLVGMLEDHRQSFRGKNDAAEALEPLLGDEVGQEAALEAGAVGILVNSLRDNEEPEMRRHGLSLLSNLSSHAESQEAMINEGARHVLIEVLRDDDDSQAGNHSLAAEVLNSLSQDVEKDGDTQMEPAMLVEALSHNQPLRAQQAILHTMRQQAQNEDFSSRAVNAGVSHVLADIIVGFLDDSDWTVMDTSIASDNSTVSNGSVAQTACKTISSIATHKHLVPALHKGGVSSALIQVLQSTAPDDLRIHAALSLERMVSQQREGTVVQEIVSSGGAYGMLQMLRDRLGDLASKVCLTALRHMALHRSTLKHMGEIDGGIELLVELVEDGSDLEKELAARALWNFAFLEDNRLRIAKGMRSLIILLSEGSSGAKQASAKALSILAVDDRYSQQLVANGCVGPLVTMLYGSPGEREAAAGALANIAYDDSSRKAIASAGAIEPLMNELALASKGSLESHRGSLVEMACQCLENLAFSEDVRPVIATPSGIESLLSVVKHGSPTGVVRPRPIPVAALGTITNLSTSDSRRTAIQDLGGIEVVVKTLREGQSADMKEASAKALWNLSYCDENRSAVAEAGGIELLVRMLESSEATGKYAAARALWNLAYTESNRLRIASAGGVQLLVSLLRSNIVKEQEAATKAIVNLTLNESIRAEIAGAGAIAPLGELLMSASSTQRAAAARALTNLAMNTKNRQEMQATGRVLPALVRMLTPVSEKMDPSVQKEIRLEHMAATKALRNIVADEGPRQAARQEGVVAALQALLADLSTEQQEMKDAILRLLEAMGELKGRIRHSNAASNSMPQLSRMSVGPPAAGGGTR